MCLGIWSGSLDPVHAMISRDVALCFQTGAEPDLSEISVLFDVWFVFSDFCRLLQGSNLPMGSGS